MRVELGLLLLLVAGCRVKSQTELDCLANDPSVSTAVCFARARVEAYEYGAAGPDSFDCSGLTQYAYRAAGLELPHSSRSQSEMGTPVARAGHEGLVEGHAHGDERAVAWDLAAGHESRGHLAGARTE